MRRYIWIILLFVIVAGMAFGPMLLSHQPPADETLTLISPHWDGIRHEFERAFAEQFLKDTGKHIRITWLDLGGGTGEIRKYLDEKFKQAVQSRGVGADILFGGGMDMLPTMADKNYFEPVLLDSALLNELPESLNGQDLRDKKFRYYASCLSSFGFVYNKLVLEKAGLPAPQRWEDLGSPDYQGWVSCGDPAASGSLHMAFELVLQAQKWENGYATLARMVSNTRAFNEGGVSIPRDVSLGQEAAGPCIDFYATAPVRRQGAIHLEFVIPKSVAVATPDCIAMLTGAPNKKAAEAFLRFVMSEAGQRLWYQARGTEGGPVDYDLERLPVMPRVYGMGLKTNTVTNPFTAKNNFTYDSRKGGARWTTLNDLWHAVLIDVHEPLWQARKAVIAAHRDDLDKVLCLPPLSEETVMKISKARLTADARNSLRNKWSGWARAWYSKIEEAARTTLPPPEFIPAPE